ncbi:MAG TPA: nuclear transport factor 2 family protein [Burkholderiaceae bacterium]|nr:nuclear transport factor 2 family protein [Burkholderiaceae bacterium]
MNEHPVSVWHRMVAARDPTGLDQLIDEAAVFYSPVAYAPQAGRAGVVMYLTAAFKVFFSPSFRYVREIVGPGDAVLEFETELDGVVVNGVDLIRWNEAGRITEFKVMLRPARALQVVQQRMAALLQPRS